MIAGGNIIALQKILGHESLAMTIKYAHPSPDHLAEARLLNPLATMHNNQAHVPNKMPSVGENSDFKLVS